MERPSHPDPKKIRLVIFSAFLVLGLWYLARPIFTEDTVLFSPRWVYGAVICALALCAMALDFRNKPTAALIILYFLFFDVSLALISPTLEKFSYGTSLKPKKSPSIFSEAAFVFHPLLQRAPRPGYSDEKYTHTLAGTRAVESGRESCAPNSSIALVGGSSTYGFPLAQGQTWADFVQGKLCKKHRVLNYGVPGFTTAEHVIQTALYLPARGIKCAVYFVGWNDLRNSFIPNLDPGYADFHLLSMAKYSRTENDRSFIATFKLMKLLMSFVDVSPMPPAYDKTTLPRSGVDPELEKIYARNIRSIIALNKQHGIRTAFIGQLMNYHALRGAPPGRRDGGWMPILEDRGVPKAMDHFNEVLRAVAGRNGVPYLEPRQSWLSPEDYVDTLGHFSARGSAKFADHVADFIESACSRGPSGKVASERGG